MLKNIIYYFSGTGNSLAVARKLATLNGNTTLIPMIQEEPLSIDSDINTIGLVYPIYINAIPKTVLNFLKKNKNIFKSFTYAVATHGSKPGVAGLNLMENMKELGIKLNAYYEIEMINNTPKGLAPKLLMHLNWEKEITSELVEKMLIETESDINFISKNIVEKKVYFKVDEKKIFNIFKRTLMKPIWNMTSKSILKVDFILDDDCIGCGRCEEVCLTNRIKLEHNQPKWIHDNCTCCYACFNFCPEQAVGVKDYTKKVGRYHHPDISLEEISQQKL